jgi:hypothetical protein
MGFAPRVVCSERMTPTPSGIVVPVAADETFCRYAITVVPLTRP